MFTLANICLLEKFPLANDREILGSKISKWSCSSITTAEDLRRSEGKAESDVQIEWTEAEVYSNIDLDLSFDEKHVLSHCNISVIPFLLRLRRKTKKHSVRSILANRVEKINLLFLEGLLVGNRVHPMISVNAVTRVRAHFFQNCDGSSSF